MESRELRMNLHLTVNPIRKLWYSGVHSWLQGVGTAQTPGCHSLEDKAVLGMTHQRATTVTLEEVKNIIITTIIIITLKQLCLKSLWKLQFTTNHTVLTDIEWLLVVAEHVYLTAVCSPFNVPSTHLMVLDSVVQVGRTITHFIFYNREARLLEEPISTSSYQHKDQCFMSENIENNCYICNNKSNGVLNRRIT